MSRHRLVFGFFALLLAWAAAGLCAADAEAARLGGKSVGRQSSSVTQRQAARSVAPSRSVPTVPSRSMQQPAATVGMGAGGGATVASGARNSWGALGGFAAGLGLAWLSRALGMEPALANFLLLILFVALALAGFSLLRRTRAPAGLVYQSQGSGGAANPFTPRQYNPTKVGNDASARPWESQDVQFDAGGAGESIIGLALRGSQGWGIPAGFDVAAFTDTARHNFITLQDAWDRSDIPALRAMMTDGMLAEIQTQLAERERAAPDVVNKTEVVMLRAQLLGIEELDDLYMASVEFSGMIREDPSAGPSPFREVWNMTKPRQGRGGWLVAGVQALQ